MQFPSSERWRNCIVSNTFCRFLSRVFATYFNPFSAQLEKQRLSHVPMLSKPVRQMT